MKVIQSNFQKDVNIGVIRIIGNKIVYEIIKSCKLKT